MDNKYSINLDEKFGALTRISHTAATILEQVPSDEPI